jgi:hypothetical protein
MFLCVAHFVFWYGMHVFDTEDVSQAARPYEAWDAINHRNPERRILVNQEIAKTPGRMLIFVRYWPQHIFQDEWVYNEADIDAARVVWARDLGEPENEKLRRYYPSRSVWLLEPDARPPKLEAYRENEVKPETMSPATTPSALSPTSPPVKPPTQPQLRFEDVPR